MSRLYKGQPWLYWATVTVLLGVVLARQSLAFDAMIPIFAFSLFQTPIGVLLLVGWRVLARYGFVAAPEPRGAATPP